jgi:hypothetical protein
MDRDRNLNNLEEWAGGQETEGYARRWTEIGTLRI